MDPKARREALRDYLNAARAALDRGDRAAAHQAVDAALAIDPEFLAAQTLKEHLDRAPQRAAPGARTPASASLPIRESSSPAGPISALTEGPPVSGTVPSAAPPPKGASPARPTGPRPTDAPASESYPPLPVVSSEGWARFEHRARQRRIQKRAEAARRAITRKRFVEAREAMSEIQEIDSAHPDLISLGMELDAAEHLHRAGTRHWGPGLAAGVVFAALLLGARYLEVPAQRGPQFTSDPSIGSKGPERVSPAPARDARLEDAARAAAAETFSPQPGEPMAQSEPSVPSRTVSSGERPEPSEPRVDSEVAVRSRVTALPAPERRASQPVSGAGPARPGGAGEGSRPARSEWTDLFPRTEPIPTRTGGTLDSAPFAGQMAPPPPSPAMPAATPAVTSAVADGVMPTELNTAVSTASSSRELGRDADLVASRPSSSMATILRPRDEDLVRGTLQQYRSAYENLDARSAQAVWPRVDGVALQRAFDGLQSQRLTFDDCQVQVRGTIGSAVCHGSARYVPKVGSREPRVEPRVWTFGLRKSGEDWQIDTARAER